MPEGDTIFRTARTLQLALAGSVVTGFETQLPALARVHDDAPVTGRTVEYARATGKWLQIGFSGDLILLTHMLMSGSWHIYRPGEAWQRHRYDMRVAISTAKIVAVAFNVQVAEFHTARSLERRRGFSQLGPDVLAPDFDEADAVARLASNPDLEIGVALLTQSIVAGLGNVFKSEICFAASVNPFQKIGKLSGTQLRLVISTARKQMLANAGGISAMRQTTGKPEAEERLWVYQRTGEACRKCGAVILSRKQGEDARSSFWCPDCQPI